MLIQGFDVPLIIKEISSLTRERARICSRDFPRGSKSQGPVRGTLHGIHAIWECTIRHLNKFTYHAYVHAMEPGRKGNEYGMKPADN